MCAYVTAMQDSSVSTVDTERVLYDPGRHTERDDANSTVTGRGCCLSRFICHHN